MYHFVFVCKYRKKLLVKYGDYVKQSFYDIANTYNFKILTMETDIDHIHLIVKAFPKVSPTSIVRRLKGISTHTLWKIYGNELKKYFWNENVFWSNGYFVCSVGNASEKTIQEYINSQG